MLSKVKGFVKHYSKAIVVACVSAFMCVFACMSAFAAEETDALKTAFSSGLANVSSEILGYLALVVPVAIGIVIAYIAVRKGISFLRGLIGR